MSDDRERRREELRAKEMLTGPEWGELLDMSTADRLLRRADLTAFGVTNVTKCRENLRDLSSRAARAEQQGFLVEAISLWLQHADFWLRVFLQGRTGKKGPYDLSQRWMFGALIDESEKHGFEPQVINRLKEFNLKRVAAVHKYLLGEIKYDDLREIAEEFREIATMTSSFVDEESRP